MSVTTTIPLRRALVSRQAWAVLLVFVVVLLVLGTNHPVAPTAPQRIAALEAIIKCPACATASLAQSETVAANELKATITTWVHEGVPNSVIEQRVVSDYGTDEILDQRNPLLWIVPTVVVALGAAVLCTYLYRRRAERTRASIEDERLVAALLDGTGPDR